MTNHESRMINYESRIVWRILRILLNKEFLWIVTNRESRIANHEYTHSLALLLINITNMKSTFLLK